MRASGAQDTNLVGGDAYLARLDSILTYGPAVAIAWDLSESWPVIFVSPNITQFGYEPDDLLSGRVLYAGIIVEEDLARISEQVTEAIASRVVHSVQRYRIRTAAGEVRWLADYTTFVRDESGTARTAQGLLIDITAQVQTEERAGAFIDEHPNPMFTLDRQGRMVAGNAAARLMFQQAKTLGDSARNKFERHVEEWASLTETYEGYFSYDHHVYWVSLTPTTGGDAVNVLALDESGERAQRTLLEDIKSHVTGLIFRFRLQPDGEESIELFNPEILPQLGVDVAGITGGRVENFRNFVFAEDLPGLERSVAESAEQFTPWDHEWRIVDGDDEVRWLRGTGTPLPHTDGSVTWTSMLIDITEQKRAAVALATALKQTIDVIADAVEMRDAYTAGHQKNVAEISAAIAREMGLDDHTIDGLRLAAAVHDVGKIRIPIEVLSKPDRLTKLEYNLIKQHAEFGGELLAGIESPWPIAKIVRQHHERIDGSGYPDGLSGEDILIEARIIAVADVLEAISSARPYRPARGLSAARQELTRGRGSAYDPSVIDACMALIESGRIQMEAGSASVLDIPA